MITKVNGSKPASSVISESIESVLHDSGLDTRSFEFLKINL